MDRRGVRPGRSDRVPALSRDDAARLGAERFAPRFQPFNVFMEPGTPPITARQELAVEFTLPPDILALKLKAIEAHESQVEGMLKALGDDFFREAHREEFFRLAAER